MPDEFFKLDVHFFDHPKIMGLPAEAICCYLASVAYCNRYKTDGYLHLAIVRRLLEQWNILRQTLIEAGLWEAAESGVRVHDYAQHNRTRAQIEAQRARWRDNQKRHRSVTDDKPVTPRRVIVQEVEKEQDLTSPNGDSPIDKRSNGAKSEQIVFEAWLQTLPAGTKRDLIPMRRRRIRARLKEHLLQDCLDAARGWIYDDWKERPKQNDIEILFRPGNFEKFRDLYRNHGHRAPRTPENTPRLEPPREFDDADE